MDVQALGGVAELGVVLKVRPEQFGSNSFGVNILLPFETPTSTMQDDPKLIIFRFFFTRKLFFVMEADACALFPGGFGTHDEGFEV